MRLEKPSRDWENEHREYIREWGSSPVVPSSFSLSEYDKYEDFLVTITSRQNGEDPWVPCSCYFLVNDCNRILGMLDIRHELNDYLLNAGGHIGYSVRPSERRKGYATQILSEALLKCKELQIKRVLVICDEDNVGSVKTILKHNGIEDSYFLEADGQVKRRFWIDNVR